MKLRTALAIWLYALAATSAAAQVKVSDLPAASTLSGPEVVPGVQSGTSKKISVAQIGTYVASDPTIVSAVRAGIPDATTIASGLESAADKTKLNGIATGATANSSDATLLNRANHTGTQPISTVLSAASSRLFGRITAAGGTGEELTGTQATTLLDTVTTSLKGLAPASGGGTTNFLRADGTWAAPVGGGSGTVTSVSVTTANGVSGSVATATTTPAITLSLGAITPTSVAASGTVTGSNLSGTNTGDQTSVTGNAGTATALATGRTLAITGDLSWTSPTFNGTGNVTAAGTLANTTVTPGTYNLSTITVDSKGRITSASSGSGGTATLADADYGDIVVSGAGTAINIDTGVVTLAKQASVATGTVFYRKTAATGAPEVQTLATLKTDLGLTGTNSGDQTITLTSDVTGSGAGSFATTIATGVVTNAKLATVPTATFKGRTTAATGAPEDLTATQATALLDVATGSLKGLMSSSDFTKLAGVTAGATPMVYPGAGIPVSTGTAWTTSKTSPVGTIVGTTDTQTLTAKSLTFPKYSAASGATAGTNAQGQGVLTNDLNAITTNASNPGGATLPAAAAGMRVYVLNASTNPVNVYAASGEAIDGTVNGFASLAVNTQAEFFSTGTGFWRSTRRASLDGTFAASQIDLATGSLKGLMSSSDFTKLAGVTAGASVSSVAALTLGTSGTDLSSSVATGTTTPVITLNVPTASAANRGALSSTDWSTFNGKQAALVSGTNIKTVGGVSLLGSGDAGTVGVAYGGTGATTLSSGFLLKGNGTSAVSASVAYDDGTGVGIGTTNPDVIRLRVKGVNTAATHYGLWIENSTPNPVFSVRNDGLVTTGVQAASPYNFTTATAANLVVDSSGQLARSTSSRRYKTDIQDSPHGLADVMKLRSVLYRGKHDGSTVFGGLIAEEVDAAGLHEFVAYDAQGRPDALHYGNLVALAFKAIQEQERTIENLRAEMRRIVLITRRHSRARR